MLLRRLRLWSERHSLGLAILILLVGSYFATVTARVLVERGVVDALIDFWNQRRSG